MIDISLALLAAFIVGLSKSGIKGIFILAVALMAFVFGAKASTGILVPLLICGDIMAVKYYNRYAQWKILLRFLPWTIFGILIGVLVGKDLPEQLFLNFMAAIIISSAVLIFAVEKRKDLVVYQNKYFRTVMGFLAGLTTMIGNLAGGFSNIYFLSSRISKSEFIGTSAWLYMIINLVKLPFHLFVWDTIDLHSLQYDLYLVFMVVVGFISGVQLVKRFGELFFRKFILFATIIGAILILLK